MKTFIFALCVCFAMVCGAAENVLNINKSTDVQALKAQLEAKDTAPLTKSLIEIRIAYLENPANVDSIEKLEKFISKYFPNVNSNILGRLVLARCRNSNDFLGTLAPKAYAKYKDNLYAKEVYCLYGYPKTSVYTEQEKRAAGIEVMLNRLDAKKIEVNKLNIALKFYIDATAKLDTSMVKNDLVPVYRKAVVLLVDNPDLKPFATRVGLVLRANGIDVK